MEWKSAPVPFCCFEYQGRWATKIFPCKRGKTGFSTVNLQGLGFPYWGVEKKTTDDIVVEFKYKSIPDYDTKFVTKNLVMHLETEDLPAGKTADDVYAFAQSLVSIISVKYGETYAMYEHQRALDKEKQDKLHKQFDKQKIEKEEQEALDDEKAKKLKEKEAKKEAEAEAEEELKKAREIDQYNDDKTLRQIARQQAFFEKDFVRREKEEKIARQALESQPLEAGQTIVKERCKCDPDVKTGKTPGAGWMPCNFNSSSAADPSQAGGSSSTTMPFVPADSTADSN